MLATSGCISTQLFQFQSRKVSCIGSISDSLLAYKMAWITSLQVKGYVPIVVALFIAFTIGLNLGLHGVLHGLHSPPVPSIGLVPSQSNEANPVSTDNTVRPISKGEPIIELPHEVDVKVIKPVTSVPAVPQEAAQAPRITHKTESNLDRKLNEIQLLVSEYGDKLLKEIQAATPELVDNQLSKDIPIVLLTCNRPALLRKTLDSLLTVRGIKKQNVIISQDGALPEIAEIAKQSGFSLIQNLSGMRLRGGAAQDGASRIAMHYKYSLSSVFDSHPEADAVIVIEDDLLFSPDLYEYLMSVAPILHIDPSAFVISAWSDNGFADKVHDPFALRRTDYFPGLGWVLTRKLYKEELEPRWPTSHWDHWLRSEETSKHRDIIYPQVPRTYHNGIKGTFMNLETHNKYFRDIGYNTDPSITWPITASGIQNNNIDSGSNGVSKSVYMQGHSKVNQYRVEQLVKVCKHVTSVMDLLKYKDEVICLWVDVNTNCEGHPVAFEPIASFFGLWHEHRRGNHRGLHEFYFNSNYLLLLNVFDNRFERTREGDVRTYQYLLPPSVNPLKSTKQFDKSLLRDLKRIALPGNVNMVKATELGQNCNEVCQAVNKQCSLPQLLLINSCSALQEHFSCTSCRNSMGTEQPAFVNPRAEAQFGPGECLVNTGEASSTCEASHPSTYRLCACV